MIGQYLSNTNKSAAVLEIQKFCQLNKTLVYPKTKNFSKFSITSKIMRHMHRALDIDENKLIA